MVAILDLTKNKKSGLNREKWWFFVLDVENITQKAHKNLMGEG